MVTVGNPGNTADSRFINSFGFPIVVGSVDHVYQIGRYEITAGQYTAFLNAVAKADPNGLYNPAMADTVSSEGANIRRTGSSPNYSYSVAGDWANRPVNYVSFWDVARFANWLHNGQPTGAQGPATTESGAYHQIGNQSLFGRNVGAKFFIPTEDEWYKAAYHKNDGVTGNYWDYPTVSTTPPINTLPDPGNHANFYDSFGTGNNDYTIGRPYFRTQVGAFANSGSPYGTFDQGGNVGEWNQSVVIFSSSRGVRGGWYGANSSLLHASYQGTQDPSFESPLIGFRIAAANLTGDYSGNGVVDAADYVVWRKYEGTMTTLPNDPHGGTIGANQFNTWRANFGNIAGSGSFTSGTVPEPTALVMVLMGLFAIFRRRPIAS
jgi:formylglycine-generating enzyme required for sulfatase activity